MRKYYRPEEESLHIKIILYSMQAFSVFSLFWSIFKTHNAEFVFISILTFFIVLAPWLVQRWLHVKFSNTVKVLTMIICLSSALLGHVWNFYYIIPLWDKILHTYFGFLFMCLGLVIPNIAMRKTNYKPNKAFCILCAFMAVMTCSVLWEVIEFVMDRTLGMDMQNDSFVKSIFSYNLSEPVNGVMRGVRSGEAKGVMRSLYNISQTVIYGQTKDGQAVKAVIDGGYLDLGVWDSMIDVIAAGAGGAFFCILAAIKKGKLVKWAFPEILPWDKEEYFKHIGYKPKKGVSTKA